jgi:hypothetical protein
MALPFTLINDLPVPLIYTFSKFLYAILLDRHRCVCGVVGAIPVEKIVCVATLRLGHALDERNENNQIVASAARYDQYCRELGCFGWAGTGLCGVRSGQVRRDAIYSVRLLVAF